MLKQAYLEDLIESLFTFDVLGRDMMKLRKSPDTPELQEKLAEILKNAALEKVVSSDAEEQAQIAEAAMARVLRYVTASKAGKGKGCG